MKKRTTISVLLLSLTLFIGACGSGGGEGGSNSAPVADAGTDQYVETNTLVALDGSASTDADGNTLTHTWSFDSMPSGSSVVLSDDTVVDPTFTSDVAGEYVLHLVVNDGTVDSAPDTVTITAVTDLIYYVDALNGSDTNTGTSTAPFKTITHALNVAGTDGTIQVLPGTYDETLGETFPLILQAGQVLLGDEANKGDGTTPTVINGWSVVDGTTVKATIVGAEGAQVTGFTFNHVYEFSAYGIYSADATVTVSGNTFTSNNYGGIYLIGTGDPIIENNVFDTSSYAVYTLCQGIATIQDNAVVGGSIPVNTLVGDTVIRRNTFTSSGQVAIQIQGGSPRIEENTFTSSGYSTYGALRVWNGTPVVRGNAFTLSAGRAVTILNNAAPDLGTAADPGGNTFAGTNIETLRIETGATVASVYAIGNTWHAATPACGTEIVINTGATVYWGAGPSDTCP